MLQLLLHAILEQVIKGIPHPLCPTPSCMHSFGETRATTYHRSSQTLPCPLDAFARSHTTQKAQKSAHVRSTTAIDRVDDAPVVEVHAANGCDGGPEAVRALVARDNVLGGAAHLAAPAQML